MLNPTMSARLASFKVTSNRKSVPLRTASRSTVISVTRMTKMTKTTKSNNKKKVQMRMRTMMRMPMRIKTSKGESFSMEC